MAKNESLYDRLNTEVWKDVPGYNGRYKLNSSGELLSVDKWSIRVSKMRPCVSLTKDNKCRKHSTIGFLKELFNWEDITFKIKSKLFEGIEGEVWIPVKDWEEWYSISNKGRLKSHYDSRKTVRQESLIKPKFNHSGYHVCALCYKGSRKDVSIHRLVAQAFIPNPENKPHVNHIDFNRVNNDVSNLEWCTPLENMAHCVKHDRTYKLHEHGELHENSKLNPEKVREVRKMFYEDMIAQADIAKHFNVSTGAIGAVIAWRTWFYVDPELKDYYKNQKHTKRKSTNG